MGIPLLIKWEQLSYSQMGTNVHSALAIYRGLFSLNNSRELPIACPLGRGMGVFGDLVWPKFHSKFSVLCVVSCYMASRYIESL